MTKDNIPIKQLSISIKQLLFYLFDGHVKNLQRETKLFEISRDTNMEELNIRKKYITLQWLALLQHSHTKRNRLDILALFMEFLEYVNDGGVVVY